MTLPNTPLLGPPDFTQALAELRPQIGRYGWMWAALRFLARRRGGFPWTVWMRLQRYGNPRKPCFIGMTADGTRYLGDYRELYAAHFAVYPEDDQALLRLLKQRWQRSEGAFLDVGANMGVIAASLARSLPERPVIAFEPLPETVRRACATFALNGLQNVRLLPAAVGEQEGDLTFYTAPHHSDIASAYSATQREEAQSQATTVPCRTLDSLRNAGVLGRVGVVKMDVEGHEFKALQGAKTLLARDTPALVFEYNRTLAPQAGWTPEEAAALLAECGPYTCKVLMEEGGMASFPPDAAGSAFVNIYADIA